MSYTTGTIRDMTWTTAQQEWKYPASLATPQTEGTVVYNKNDSEIDCSEQQSIVWNNLSHKSSPAKYWLFSALNS